MKEIFEDIIKNHRWQDVPCGTGSTMQSTQPLRETLKAFLEKHNITSMFDAPCGDYSWMSQTPLPANFKYIGGDIVESLVQQSRVAYPNIEFINFDISKDSIPDVDMLFCRDCLIHFSIADINRTFDNIAKSKVKYVLLTNYFQVDGINYDISTGGFRPTNFMQAPFNFDEPVDSLLDWAPGTKNGDQKKSMNLWPRSTFERYLANR